MNSPKTYEIIESAKKYEIDKYLSFTVFYLQKVRGNAVTQCFHYTWKSKGGCPFDTCFKPIVLLLWLSSDYSPQLQNIYCKGYDIEMVRILFHGISIIYNDL